MSVMSSLLAPNIYRFRGKVNATTEIQSELVNERWMLEGLRGNRLSAWPPILQIIAQWLLRSWDNGWDSRNGSRCARITRKVRRGNDLVDFEPFLRSQML
jgi:hypothetical protein